MSEPKTEMRASYRAARSAIPPGDYERWNGAIMRRVTDWQPLVGARTVMVYEARRREVSTADIIGWLLRRDKLVLTPDAHHSGADPSSLRILGPRTRIVPARAVEGVDVFLVPGLAFDLQGNRLGQGAGYFDRVLSLAQPQAIIAGLAFEQQIADTVPHDPWDIRMHYLITEARLVECSP